MRLTGPANSNVATIALHVGDLDPPVVANPGSQLNTEGDHANLQIQASLLDGDVLLYSATNLPPGLSIDLATGLISGTVASTFSQHGPYPVTVFVSNASATATTAVSFTWTVNNVPPSVTSHDYAVAENTLVTVTAPFGVLTGSSDPARRRSGRSWISCRRMARSRSIATARSHTHRHRLHRA